MIAATWIDRQRCRERGATDRFRENRDHALRAAAGGRDRAVSTGRRNCG